MEVVLVALVFLNQTTHNGWLLVDFFDHVVRVSALL